MNNAKEILIWMGVFLVVAVMGITCGHALEETRTKEEIARCEVYKENPSWLSTMELKVWHKMHCKEKGVER